MKSFNTMIMALVLGFSAATSEAATVTYTLTLDTDGPGTFSLTADVSLGDNFGLALYGVPLTDVTSYDHLSPNAGALLSAPPFFTQVGFSLFRTADNDLGSPIGATQDTFNASSLVVYGLGQTAGSLSSLPNVTGFVPGAESVNYDASLLLATGTYGSILPGFDTDSVDLLANVFVSNSSRQVIPANIVTQVVVPEVGTFAMMGVATLVGAVAVARRKQS